MGCWGGGVGTFPYRKPALSHPPIPPLETNEPLDSKTKLPRRPWNYMASWPDRHGSLESAARRAEGEAVGGVNWEKKEIGREGKGANWQYSQEDS